MPTSSKEKQMTAVDNWLMEQNKTNKIVIVPTSSQSSKSALTVSTDINKNVSYLPSI